MHYDGEWELRPAIEKELGPISDDDWTEALIDADVISPNGLDASAKKKVMKALGERGYTRKTEKEQEPLWGVIARAELEANDDSVARIVQALRKNRFGTTEPPFPGDLDAMRRWIEKEREEMEKSPAPESIFWPRDQINELSTILRYSCKISLNFLSWPARGGGKARCKVMPRSTLDLLRGAAELVAKMMGVQPAQAVALILCGLTPIPSPVCVTQTKGGRGAVTIKVTTPDVSPSEVAAIYREARQEVWGVTRTDGATERDRALVKFVPLGDAEGLIWEERRKRWNSEHPKWRYDNPDAMRMAYRSALKKIWRPAW